MLLLLGMLIPSALQATQAVDFCMMEMNHHEMQDTSHDRCETKEPQQGKNKKDRHNCGEIQICACSTNQTLAKNQFTIPSVSSATVILSQNGFNFTVNSPDEFIFEDYFTHARQHSPPIYLLNDTFLN